MIFLKESQSQTSSEVRDLREHLTLNPSTWEEDKAKAT